MVVSLGETKHLKKYYITCMTNKHLFLTTHNQLSPIDLQATDALLTRFRLEKKSLFKDNLWSLDKLRRPFIFWLTSLNSQKRAEITGTVQEKYLEA